MKSLDSQSWNSSTSPISAARPMCSGRPRPMNRWSANFQRKVARAGQVITKSPRAPRWEKTKDLGRESTNVERGTAEVDMLASVPFFQYREGGRQRGFLDDMSTENPRWRPP